MDNIDNTGNGVIDENSSVDAQTWYADNDNDNFGSANTTQSCTIPDGYIANSEDCDDADNDIPRLLMNYAMVWMTTVMVLSMEMMQLTALYSLPILMAIFPKLSMTKSACSVPENHAGDNTDCNDANEDISPNANDEQWFYDIRTM